MVRISAGVLKGFRIDVPPRVRPTTDQVRQAMFNIVGSRVEGSRILDAFAGSGAVGIEALSRGASHVTFLELEPAHIRMLRANADRMPSGAAPGTWVIVGGDALGHMRRLAGSAPPFDLVFIDPPYEAGLGKKSLNVVAGCAILSPVGLLCIEHARQHELPTKIGPLEAVKQHRYGETVLSFYQSPNPVQGLCCRLDSDPVE